MVIYKGIGHNLMKGNQKQNELKSKEGKKVSFGKLGKHTAGTHARVLRPCMRSGEKHKDTRPAYTPVYGPCMGHTSNTRPCMTRVQKKRGKLKDTHAQHTRPCAQAVPHAKRGKDGNFCFVT